MTNQWYIRSEWCLARYHSSSVFSHQSSPRSTFQSSAGRPLSPRWQLSYSCPCKARSRSDLLRGWMLETSSLDASAEDQVVNVKNKFLLVRREGLMASEARSPFQVWMKQVALKHLSGLGHVISCLPSHLADVRLWYALDGIGRIFCQHLPKLFVLNKLWCFCQNRCP